MANTPKKMKDPTEAALSAIQDALHVRDDDDKDTMATPSASALPADAATDAPWPGLRSSAKSDVYADEDLRRSDDNASPRRPAANDDQELIGNILRTIQRRPAKHARNSLPSVFAAVWVIGGFLLGWLYLPEIQAALGPTGLTAPVLLVLGAIYLAPVVFFYVLAHMAVRSQEMRLIAQSMAEVAMRLAEPETVGAGVDRHRRSGDPPRGRGHGRRHRARVGARRRARDPGRQRGVGARTRYKPATKYVSARCCRTSAASATRWSDRPSRSATPSTACTSTSATISRRSASSLPNRSTTPRAASP